MAQRPTAASSRRSLTYNWFWRRLIPGTRDGHVPSSAPAALMQGLAFNAILSPMFSLWFRGKRGGGRRRGADVARATTPSPAPGLGRPKPLPSAPPRLPRQRRPHRAQSTRPPLRYRSMHSTSRLPHVAAHGVEFCILFAGDLQSWARPAPHVYRSCKPHRYSRRCLQLSWSASPPTTAGASAR